MVPLPPFTRHTTAMTKTAVIDIGSNSVRLMKVTDKSKTKVLKTTQLGRGLEKTGMLGKLEIEATIRAIEEFLSTLDGYSVYAFATEAVRAASNGAQFTQAVRERTGLNVDVLSKSEEATAGFIGATKGNALCTVIDIGGGSTEFARGKAEVQDSVSIPIGAVRLTDMRNDGIDTTKYVKSILPEFVFAGKIIGIGGTVTSVASIMLDLVEYEPNKVDGYQITKQSLLNLERKFSTLTPDEIFDIYPVVGRARAKVLYEGIKLLLLLMNTYGIESVTASDSDNTEGYLIMRKK